MFSKVLISKEIQNFAVRGTAFRSLYLRIHHPRPLSDLISKRFVHLPPSYKPLKKFLTNEEKQEQILKEKMKSDKWWVRWGAIAQSKGFNKSITKVLIVAYIGFIIYGFYHFKDLYSVEKEVNHLNIKKYGDEARKPQKLNQYEELLLKKLTKKLRTRDEVQFQKYEELIKQKENEFYEDPKNVGKLFELDPAVFNGVVLDNYKENEHNKCILPARDTTEFYDEKAEEYDGDINFEEKLVLLGGKRKKLMRKAFGDVLEVSCGTGRNIKYINIDDIDSITFLDSSKNMMEVAHEKFREKFPTYKKVAFVVGKAEDLTDLASGNSENISSKKVDKEIENIHSESKIKYDTIIETFGLCSHKDPVKALQNFGKLLKPGGRIFLLEHGRGTWDFINNHLDNRAEKRLKTWGCRWNLDIGEIIDDSGLEIVEETRHQFGTMWMVILKKPGDVKRYEELTLFEKYFKNVDE